MPDNCAWTRAERSVLRLCAEGVRIGDASGYAESWDIGQSTFCLSEAMLRRLERKLDPLMPVFRRWVTRREGRFVVFACSNDGGSRGAVRSILQSAAAQARRRARLEAAEGHHLRSHYRILWDIQAGKCYFSGEQLGDRFEDRAFAVDHLTPIATRPPPFAGIPGTDWPVNLALVTKRVNSMKGADDAPTFIWRLRHQPRRYHPAFVPTASKVRAAIDKLRRNQFGEFMAKHCLDWEARDIP